MRRTLFLFVIAALTSAAGAPAEPVPRILDATPEYCSSLADRLAALPASRAEPFRSLGAEGAKLCGDGHVRTGVTKLRRALRAAQPVLALICVAMFGLVVSPVSWSHHWVWALPTVLASAVLAVRLRHVALGVVSAAGLALMVWTPITLMPEHRETAASLWRQLAGGSYIWWALAVIIVTGVVAVRSVGQDRPSVDAAPVPVAKA